MSLPQGYEKAPQIRRKNWLAALWVSVAAQIGAAIDPKLAKVAALANIVADGTTPVPVQKGGEVFMTIANAMMARRCDQTGKSFEKHSILLTTTDPKQSKRTIGAKSNSTRNFYLAKFAFIDPALLPEAKRDSLGNVQRKDLYVVEGEGENAKRVINPLVAGKVEQAKWIDLQGIPQVAGRSTADDDLLSDDGDDDFDF